MYETNIQGVEVDYVKFSSVFSGKEVFLFRELTRDHSVEFGDKSHDKNMDVKDFRRFKNKKRNNHNSFKLNRFKSLKNKRKNIKFNRFIDKNSADEAQEAREAGNSEVQSDNSDDSNRNETFSTAGHDDDENEASPLHKLDTLRVVYIRSPNTETQIKSDVGLADYVCVIPGSFESGNNQ